MKAWLAKEKGEICATVVFAETRGKARALALYTDCCEGADFCDIEVNRKPQMDKYYTPGKTEMDWDVAEDRIALVKDCDFVCERDYWEWEDCKTCPANQYCDRAEEAEKALKELENNG